MKAPFPQNSSHNDAAVFIILNLSLVYAKKPEYPVFHMCEEHVEAGVCSSRPLKSMFLWPEG